MDTSPIQTPDEIVKALGERIKARRLASNVTQSALSDKAGVSRRALVQLEGGYGSTLHTLASVLKALGLEAELSALVHRPSISPMALLLATRKRRKRAS